MTNAHDAATASHHVHDDDTEGLAFDLPLLLRLARPVQVITRRKALGMFGGASALALIAACGSSSNSSSTTVDTTSAPLDTSSSNTTTAGSVDVSAGAEIPDETGGPFPGDGTNGPNALTESGIVRSDIRSSFGPSTTVADGIPVTFNLTVVAADTGAALPGAAVYLWHCDRNGDYSLYSDGVTGENYLRGVQAADDNGNLTFVSIFPGCYSGRWPHAHFEVYDTLDAATVGSNATKTSQLAMPEAACNEAFVVSGYESSVSNFAQISLATDNVFSDGADDQLPTITGNATDGYTADLLVRV